MDRPVQILILEDDASDAELIQRELRKAAVDHVAKCAPDKRTFLQILEEFAPDLLLADYSLPGFDGLSALRLARQRFPRLPGIIVSGAIGEELAIEALKAGASDYVLKQRLSRLGPVVHRAIRDIERLAEKDLAEEALHRSEERFRLLVEGVKDYAIVTLDEEGRVATWNAGAQRIKGYAAHEIVGEHFAVFYTQQEIAAGKPQHILQMAAREGQYAEEGWRVRKDGSRFWGSVTVTAVRDPAGELRGFAKITRDMTEQRRAEEALRSAKAQAERWAREAEDANHAKDQFLAVLSHELRNPLSPVLPALSMLRQKAGLDGATHEAMQLIQRNIELEARLIDDLLDVARISRGKIELDRRPVDVCSVIERAVEVCRPEIEARRLHFGMDMGTSAPYIIDADAARLQQVFWNLLKNAVKFTPQNGSVGIRVRELPGSVHHATDEAGASAPGNRWQAPTPSILVEVSDSGAGIDPAALPRIFDAFQQADRSVTREFGGLGLGLTISKALVEMHGGAIDAKSDGKGKGSTFRVLLPLAAHSGTRAAGPPQLHGELRQRAIRSLHILLVEDHSDTAAVMQQVLTLDGHKVEIAGDVATALDLAGKAKGALDLIISDLGLPDGSGLELIPALRARGIDLPGIAISGYGQEKDIQQSRDAGFLVHLVKPVSLQQLEQAIAKLVSDQAGIATGQRQTIT